jgi:hypothetical protein
MTSDCSPTALAVGERDGDDMSSGSRVLDAELPMSRTAWHFPLVDQHRFVKQMGTLQGRWAGFGQTTLGRGAHMFWRPGMSGGWSVG